MPSRRDASSTVLVGFELSPVLWRKIRPSLSAGRVQSVGVRIIVDREREIDAHTSQSTFRVVGHFHTGKAMVKASCSKTFASEAEAQRFLDACLGADTWSRRSRPNRPRKNRQHLSPPPPSNKRLPGN